MKKTRIVLPAVFVLLSACTASPPPAETTADGLARVPSSSDGGVYRRLDVDFTRFKLLMIEPLTVEFRESWRKQHPDVSSAEVHRLEAETMTSFHDAFTNILVGEGPFELAEVRDADVMVVVPRLLDLNIPAPETESDTGFRSYSPRAISMEMTGELRDGVSGEVLLRVIVVEPEDRIKFNQVPGPNRLANAREIRNTMEKWSRLVREAIDVAKTSKPH